MTAPFGAPLVASTPLLPQRCERGDDNLLGGSAALVASPSSSLSTGDDAVSFAVSGADLAILVRAAAPTRVLVDTATLLEMLSQASWCGCRNSLQPPSVSSLHHRIRTILHWRGELICLLLALSTVQSYVVYPIMVAWRGNSLPVQFELFKKACFLAAELSTLLLLTAMIVFGVQPGVVATCAKSSETWFYLFTLALAAASQVWNLSATDKRQRGTTGFHPGVSLGLGVFCMSLLVFVGTFIDAIAIGRRNRGIVELTLAVFFSTAAFRYALVPYFPADFRPQTELHHQLVAIFGNEMGMSQAVSVAAALLMARSFWRRMFKDYDIVVWRFTAECIAMERGGQASLVASSAAVGPHASLANHRTSSSRVASSSATQPDPVGGESPLLVSTSLEPSRPKEVGSTTMSWSPCAHEPSAAWWSPNIILSLCGCRSLSSAIPLYRRAPLQVGTEGALGSSNAITCPQGAEESEGATGVPRPLSRIWEERATPAAYLFICVTWILLRASDVVNDELHRQPIAVYLAVGALCYVLPAVVILLGLNADGARHAICTFDFWFTSVNVVWTLGANYFVWMSSMACLARALITTLATAICLSLVDVWCPGRNAAFKAVVRLSFVVVLLLTMKKTADLLRIFQLGGESTPLLSQNTCRPDGKRGLAGMSIESSVNVAAITLFSNGFTILSLLKACYISWRHSSACQLLSFGVQCHQV